MPAEGDIYSYTVYHKALKKHFETKTQGEALFSCRFYGFNIYILFHTACISYSKHSCVSEVHVAVHSVVFSGVGLTLGLLEHFSSVKEATATDSSH